MALRQIRERINPTVTHACWLEEFMGSGVELEHAGFLALWLSRHVFPPRSASYIRSSLFSLAARLSTGMKIALAPVVLANIYRDLSLLKDKIAGSSSKGSNDESLVLSAPFQLVQLWAWERFPTLAPIPRVITHGEPRLARWSKLRNPTCGDLSMALDSPKEAFVWRPYATNVENLSLACFYGDMEKWVSLDSGGPWESFARCLRVCQLVGLDCIEEYLPHRVAMQFGMDQDIPSSVPIVRETLKVTWNNYNRPIIGVKLYVPSRMFKGYVSARYSDWWKGVPLSQAGSVQSCKQPRTDQRNSYGLTAIMNAKTQGKHFDKNDGQKLVESFRPCNERNQNSKLSLAYSLPNKNDKVRRVFCCASHYGWMNHFKGKEGELEHVALLVLWLSRYVFSTNSCSMINPKVSGIAISLAKGVKVALAYAVLSAIYRDLRLLKEKIVTFTEGRRCRSDLVLWAPLQISDVVLGEISNVKPETDLFDAWRAQIGSLAQD
ncbi:hypothetical protein Cgig2_004614 [Carnegiea gigantea]|uniref:Aminotransferase-like plant mobile domain-containing protein n=1 Tax=Carnegiea gigantea TaxID=171969 RepID=A0A9Q1JZX8_9CARY|nr:hypothetical protein Cgig2_004614 [Carnegiea gigantea]